LTRADPVEQDLIGWIHDIGSNGFLFSTVLRRWSARGLGDARAVGHKNCLWSLLLAMAAQGESNMGAAMTISKAACVDGDTSAICGDAIRIKSNPDAYPALTSSNRNPHSP